METTGEGRELVVFVVGVPDGGGTGSIVAAVLEVVAPEEVTPVVRILVG